MEILDKQVVLDRYKFWDNQDWSWYKENIPFFDSPDQQINEIYYYRWEVLTKHLRYTAPETGYVLTEFNSTVRNAGRYNAICCPAGLQINEARWLHNPQYVEDYCRYWMYTTGAQPHNYSWSAAYAIWSAYLVQDNAAFTKSLIEPLLAYHRKWRAGWVDYPHDNGYMPEIGLYWNTGRDSSGEYNMASAQLNEQLRGIREYKVRGGAGYRPDINADMFADLWAISKIAGLAGRIDTAHEFSESAATLRDTIQKSLWDPNREFFMHRWRYDEYSEGDSLGAPSIKAGSFIWETNIDRYGGVGHQPDKQGYGHGRELIGYVPWYYHLPNLDGRYDIAWKYLMDPQYFYGAFGPTTAERHDPWFSIIYGKCRMNGNSWPLNTSKVLVSAANLINDYPRQPHFSKADYLVLLKNYTRSHYKEGRPYLAESHHPDKDEWTVDQLVGRHYFHSCYTNCIITGLVGLRPRNDQVLEVNPLIPDDWAYFALDDIHYHGHQVSILWDRDGSYYKKGVGLHIFVDGQLVASRPVITKIEVDLPLKAKKIALKKFRIINLAVNNEQNEYPAVTASHTGPGDQLDELQNGMYWYHQEPHNRWTCRGTKNLSDWVAIDLGAKQRINAVKVYLYEDDEIASPTKITVEYWDKDSWQQVNLHTQTPDTPKARLANFLEFEPIYSSMMRLVLTHKPGFASGIVELELLQA